MNSEIKRKISASLKNNTSVSSKYPLSTMTITMPYYKGMAELSERRDWEELIKYVQDFVEVNGKMEPKNIPTRNVPTKNQHDITQFAIKAIDKLTEIKFTELSNLENLGKTNKKEKKANMKMIEKCSKRIEELKKELQEEEAKMANAKNSLKLVDHRMVEISDQIQAKEKDLELLKKSGMELGNHLEMLRRKLDQIDSLIQQRDMSSFTVEDVGMILREIGLGKFEEAFKEHEIEGVAFMKMKEKHLIDLGMENIHDRKKVLHTIDLIQIYGIIHPLPSINTIYNWNSERVCEWLKEIGFEGKSEEFRKMNINGMILLHLSEEDLDILKITKLGDRMRLLNAIEKLKRSQKNVMDQMTKANQSKEGSKTKRRIPDSFYCPITMKLMKDPVMASDGYVYERRAIEEWFRTHDTSPSTHLKVEDKKLVPCHPIKNAIDQFNANANAS
jgi:hypothetical protein